VIGFVVDVTIFEQDSVVIIITLPVVAPGGVAQLGSGKGSPRTTQNVKGAKTSPFVIVGQDAFVV
jgi:hypothetical protein